MEKSKKKLIKDEVTIWNSFFGDNKLVDLFKRQKLLKKKKCLEVMSATLENTLDGSKGEIDEGKSSVEKKSTPTKDQNCIGCACCVDCNSDTNTCRRGGKECGWKIEFLWMMKCPACKKKHACHCIRNEIRPKTKTTCEKERDRLKNENDMLLDRLRELEKEFERLLKQLMDEVDYLKGVIDQKDHDSMIQDESKNKWFEEIQRVIDHIDKKLDGTERLMDCIERQKSLLSKAYLTNRDRYRLERSKTNPSVLCIKPPLKEEFNICKTINECINTHLNNPSMTIHGQRYVNENNEYTICDLINDTMISVEENDSNIIGSFLEKFSCINPFCTAENDSTSDPTENENLTNDEDQDDKYFESENNVQVYKTTVSKVDKEKLKEKVGETKVSYATSYDSLSEI